MCIFIQEVTRYVKNRATTNTHYNVFMDIDSPLFLFNAYDYVPRNGSMFSIGRLEGERGREVRGAREARAACESPHYATSGS